MHVFLFFSLFRLQGIFVAVQPKILKETRKNAIAVQIIKQLLVFGLLTILFSSQQKMAFALVVNKSLPFFNILTSHVSCYCTESSSKLLHELWRARKFKN
jgi:hypothetical protein